MNKSRWLLIGLLILVSSIVIFLAGPVSTSSQAQSFYSTPTPDAEGRVFYTVKSGDSCITVSLLNNITVEQLRVLNDLDETCMLAEGRKLLIATVVVQPTAAAIPSATSALPSPTPFRGNGEVCVILFNDINGNAVAEDGEAAIPGGAIDISDRLGKVSLTGKTSSSIEEPTCFMELPEGDYNVSLAVPDGYNPTTRMNYALKVTAGDNTKIDFGAQLNSKAVPTPVTEGGRSPLLGILGVVVVLAGLGMGFYARRTMRR